MANGGILQFGGIRVRDVPRTIAIFDAMCKINSAHCSVGMVRCSPASADWWACIVWRWWYPSAWLPTELSLHKRHDCYLATAMFRMRFLFRRTKGLSFNQNYGRMEIFKLWKTKRNEKRSAPFIAKQYSFHINWLKLIFYWSMRSNIVQGAQKDLNYSGNWNFAYVWTVEFGFWFQTLTATRTFASAQLETCHGQMFLN